MIFLFLNWIYTFSSKQNGDSKWSTYVGTIDRNLVLFFLEKSRLKADDCHNLVKVLHNKKKHLPTYNSKDSNHKKFIAKRLFFFCFSSMVYIHRIPQKKFKLIDHEVFHTNNIQTFHLTFLSNVHTLDTNTMF